MFSLKLILAGVLLLSGASQSFAGEPKEASASSERKKIAPRKAQKKVKAKKSLSQASGPVKPYKGKKRIESSSMFPPDNH